MHSRIFHILPSIKELQKNERSYEDYDTESIEADYIRNSEDWDEDVDWFMQVIPEGMFTMEKTILNEGTGDEDWFAKLTYTKYPQEYLEKYISDIKEYAQNLTIESLKDWYSRWKFVNLVKNNDNDFYIDEGEAYSDLSTFHDWILSIASNCKIGDVFYIGSIMDYHF